MDWYIVEYLYPKAFNKFVETMFPNLGIVSVSTLDFYDIKKLYQFFDKQGVYLTIEMYRPHQWCFTVSLQNGTVFGPMKEFRSTRTEIENDGFLECFRILEKKLVVVYE